MAEKVTPVMRQFDAAKAAYPDAIVFFRLGDFYEMFRQDAVVVSKLLGLTLTSRNKGSADEIPMAGVPYHAAHTYIAKLLRAGHRIAVCEQMADPSQVKGIVPREVVRVLTPATVTESEHVDAKSSPVLVAAAFRQDQWGIAAFDVTTSDLQVGKGSSTADLLVALSRLEPKEMIVPADAPAGVLQAIQALLPHLFVRQADGQSDSSLKDHAHLREELARIGSPVALEAAARVLGYTSECMAGRSARVERFSVIELATSLQMDDAALAHLEVVVGRDGGRTGSLLGAVDETVTAAGARELRARLISPSCDKATITSWHAAVEALVSKADVRAELRRLLSDTADVARIVTRAHLGEVNPRELRGLLRTLSLLPAISTQVSLVDISEAGTLPKLDDVEAHLSRALSDSTTATLKDGGVIRTGYDVALDEQRGLHESASEHLAALEAALRLETGIPTLRVKHTGVFGHYMEVSKSHAAKVPARFVRKQTVTNGERFTCDELETLSKKLEQAEARALSRERELWAELVTQVSARSEALCRAAYLLSGWDVAAGFAEVAHRRDYARPSMVTDPVLMLEGARHPVVEQMVEAGAFVPNDVALDAQGDRVWLITGPNMGGKSTFMRTAALSVILAHAGGFVPATRANVGLVDRILSRLGSGDHLSRGESTFMVEMRETASILRRATPRSLVLIDEIGRGTSTYDGLSIAWAVLEHLAMSVRCRTLFATHYHELTELGDCGIGISNHAVTARERGGEVVLLHRVAAGAASRSYGVAVAKLAGLPEAVLARARVVLKNHEKAREGMAPAKSGEEGQLGLFAAPSPRQALGEELVAMVEALDIERLAPLEALVLLSKWKESLPQGENATHPPAATAEGSN